MEAPSPNGTEVPNPIGINPLVLSGWNPPDGIPWPYGDGFPSHNGTESPSPTEINPSVLTGWKPPALSGRILQGHRAYLSSAPHYDFPRYRQLVHELTLGFSRISREVLQLQARLRDQHGRPELAQHLARLQEREQEKLQLLLLFGAPRIVWRFSIRSRRLIKTIEAISEILQDLKYDSEEAE
uniref:Uncharacterized protein n=1 Tax=Anas platyrhynchos TaxID=8839 RepID=A0A8B9T8N2_ANAPL